MKKSFAIGLLVVLLFTTIAACTRYVPFIRDRQAEGETTRTSTCTFELPVCTPGQTESQPPETPPITEPYVPQTPETDLPELPILLDEAQRDENGFYWVVMPMWNDNFARYWDTEWQIEIYVYDSSMLPEDSELDIALRNLIQNGFTADNTRSVSVIGTAGSVFSAHGLINKITNEHILPHIFDDIVFIDDDYAFVSFNHYFGIMHVTRTLEVGAFQKQCFEPDENGLVWMVPPSFEYGELVFCWCGEVFDYAIKEENRDIHILINPNTGAKVERYKAGHGGYGSTILYDPTTNYFLISMSHNEEFVHRNQISEWIDRGWLSNFVGKASIDIENSEFCCIINFCEECQVPIIYLEQYALFYRGEQITEFIFTRGNTWDGNYGGGLRTTQLISTELWGILDRYGNIVLPFHFEHIIFIDNARAFVKIDGLYGVMHVGKTLQNLNS